MRAEEDATTLSGSAPAGENAVRDVRPDVSRETLGFHDEWEARPLSFHCSPHFGADLTIIARAVVLATSVNVRNELLSTRSPLSPRLHFSSRRG
ncbi:hypothetical protein MTO96_000450 [Rhipicephalus appendiculatus]